MRVPTLTATAGYAAPTHFDAYLNEQYFDGLQSTAITAATTTTTAAATERNKNNGNIDLLSSQQPQHQTQLSSQHTTEFISSADEFVKRALNSAPSTSYKVESNFEFLRACSENKNFNSHEVKQSPTEQEDANQYNTYRSFKDAFNVNRIFYEECAKNFDGINVQDPQDIDPILIINSPYPVDDITERDSTNAFENMKINSTAQEENTKKIDTNIAETKDHDLFDDNDYDDHAMLDLCSEENDEDVKEFIDRDAYLTSPSSSSISDHTPKRTFSYFPRGIINPNYPGFQHLAHTLTEHFITGTSGSDSYDSDISEYEMELSADSFEDLTEEATEQLKLKLNRFNNNFAEQQVPSTMHPDELLDIELRETHDVYDDAFISEGAENVIQTKIYGDDNCNVDLKDLRSSLQTTLTLFEPKHQLVAPEPEHSSAFHCEEKLKYGATTPDILMKHDQSYLHVNASVVKKENRPDLLYGVSPQHLGNNRPKKIGEVKTPVKSEQNLLRASARLAFETPIKDEISLGVTPVDIIGDFGQEVEREFGLLVSGYRRLMDEPPGFTDIAVNEQIESISKQKERLVDAELSNANDEIDANKYLAALNQFNQCEDTTSELLKSNSDSSLNKTTTPITNCDFIEDNNAVDWSCSPDAVETVIEKPHNTTPMDSNSGTNEASTTIFINEDSHMEDDSKSDCLDESKKPRYQKSSYDERQLPPVAIEYKRCLQHPRSGRKAQHGETKATKTTKKASFTNRLLHGKRSVFRTTDKPESNCRKREEAEIHQYKQLISDKELILSNSRYAKLSTWAQYLKNSVKDKSATHSTELMSPSALELFDAYKVGGEVDRETLQKHLKMAKEIEKKRRSDREEIRRRLAMGGEENANTAPVRPIQKPSLQSALHNGLYICRFNDISSDTESHSSDSETCPKLSKIRQQNQFEAISSSTNIGEITSTKTSTSTAATHPYHGRPLSVSCTNKELQQQKQHKEKQKELLKIQQQQQQQKLMQQELLPITDEDRECDFFTKQARLQIEARMALSQAKEMAHMQMEVERQNRRMSPITGIIRNSLDKIGVQMTMDKRRVSRQMLTDMNIAQLQILVNSLHTHIEDLNESLVQFLMERDDLHVGQDAMLVDIEELTRYIGAQEHLTNEHKKSSKCNRSK